MRTNALYDVLLKYFFFFKTTLFCNFWSAGTTDMNKKAGNFQQRGKLPDIVLKFHLWPVH